MPSNHPTFQTFFDLHFEPDVMVGPATLDFLTDFLCRNSPSVEGMLLILQLAHLKHFDEPLTTFVRDEQLDSPSAKLAFKKLSDSKAAAFVSSLFSWSFGSQELASDEEGWPVKDVAGLLASIAEARTDFRSRLRRLKLAFGMLRKVHEVMLNLGYRVTGSEMSSLEMMSASLKGGLEQNLTSLAIMTRSVTYSTCQIQVFVFHTSWGGTHRKLPSEKLSILLRELWSFLHGLPDHLDEVREAKQRVTTTAAQLEHGDKSATGVPIAYQLGDWLVWYFRLVFFLVSSRDIMSADKLMRNA